MSTFQYGGIVEQVSVTATAGGTTTLVNTSNQIQIFTGTQNQTVIFPAANTYTQVGAKFEIYNESSGNLTLQFNGGTAFTDAAGVNYNTVLPHTSLIVKVQTIATAAGTWAVFSGALTSLPTASYAQAKHAGTMSWNTSSASFADPSSTGATPALTIRQSSGITLTQAGSNLPGITFTPASTTAVYLITVSTTIQNSTASDGAAIQLTDEQLLLLLELGQYSQEL